MNILDLLSYLFKNMDWLEALQFCFMWVIADFVIASYGSILVLQIETTKNHYTLGRIKEKVDKYNKVQKFSLFADKINGEYEEYFRDIEREEN